jgi:hypothetical protein
VSEVLLEFFYASGPYYAALLHSVEKVEDVLLHLLSGCSLVLLEEQLDDRGDALLPVEQCKDVVCGAGEVECSLGDEQDGLAGVEAAARREFWD